MASDSPAVDVFTGSGTSPTEPTITVIRMWQSGPLRQMASSKMSNTFIPCATTINGHTFAGRYVCDGCQAPCSGVRRSDVAKMSRNRHSNVKVGWHCVSCRQGKTRIPRTTEQRRAAAQRLTLIRHSRSVQ